MHTDRRREELANAIESILYEKDILNEHGKKHISQIAIAITRAVHGYFFILKKDQSNAAKKLADRWFKIHHDPMNIHSFRGGERKHSFYGFAQWLDTNYYIFAVPRKAGILWTALNKFCSKLFVSNN